MDIIDFVINNDITMQAMRAGGGTRRKKNENRSKGINDRLKDRANKPSRKSDDPVDQASKKKDRGQVNGIVEGIMGQVKTWHDMATPDWGSKSNDERKQQVNSEIDWGKVKHDFNFITEWNDQIVNDIVKKLDDYHKIND